MSALLVRLLRLFPRPFRARFEDEMAAQIELELGRARARGTGAACWLTLVIAADLIRAAVAERRDPTWFTPRATRATARGERDVRELLEGWGGDLRQAARALGRTPGFAAVAAITLGLAIGTTAGMFSVVDAVLLDPLPYEHVDRLVHIGASAPGSEMPAEFPVSSEFYLQYRELSRLLEEISTYDSFTNTFRTPDRAERIRMSTATPTLFRTLGARPILGRLPGPEDGDQTILISSALWSSWFANDPAVVGRTFEVGRERRTVIGVMAPEFRFPVESTMLWLPEEIRAEGLRPGRFGARLVARTKPGVTPEQLANELDGLARRLPERFGGSPNYQRLMSQHRAVVRPLEEQLLGSVARPLYVLLGATLLVLLVACANVANLFLVRAEGRQRDLAVRRAIGAARGQLVRLQMAEALVVAALAGGLAIALAALVVPVAVRAAPDGIPRLAEAGLHPPTLLFTLAAALASAVACGLVPALRASAPDLSRLRAGGRGSTRRRRWARAALVSGQTALSLLLLIGSGLLVRSVSKLRQVDPGYSTADLYSFQFAPEQPALVDGPSWARFHLAFLDRLAKLPGVRAVGLVENLPLDEGTAQANVFAEGKGVDGDGGTLVHYTFTAGAYFPAMGIELLAGRLFGDDDQLATETRAIVSRSAAQRLWPNENPLGRRFKSPQGDAMVTVVGVVDDVLQGSFRDQPEAVIYLPLAGPTPTSWRIATPAYVIKSARAEAIAGDVRALVREVAPEAPIYREFTLAELAERSMVDLSFTLLVLGLASALALVLGTVGLYGVLSYIVAERAREIGVRMALGARAGEVRRMVVADGLRVVGIGVAVGIAASMASMRALGGLLYGVEPIDAATFVATSLAMIVVGLLASYLPARRASKVAPIESLRAE